MPSTRDTGTGAVPKPQTHRRQPAKPKQETAPAAPAPTPPAPPEQSMFDETPPAPPAAEQPPVERVVSSDPPAAPADAPASAEEEGVAEAPQGAEDPAPPAPSAPEPAPAPETAPAAQDNGNAEGKAAGADPSGSPTRVRLGRVEGALHRVPLEVVQMLVAESGSRIETLRTSPSIADLQARMRATEGRCAPIVFTMAEGDDHPRLFAGVEAIAAAINLALPTVYVITIASGDAGAAQQHLASRANERSASTLDEVFETIE